jgi:pimeloyl-ACP methyl ester carboxylesterase
MRGLSQIFSVLLASAVKEAPTKFTDLSSQFSGIYEELQGAPIYKDYSPTIKFSFVSPPDSILDDVKIAESRTDSIFESVTTNYGDEKPIVVYLPGLDCAGISAYQQYAELSDKFELWRMTVTTTDRTSLRDLSNNVVKFIEEVSNGGKREVTLIGESFGGQLAPIVALKLQARKITKLQGLVMVNPATSFDETNWDVLGPLLASLRVLQSSADQEGATPYTVLGGLALSSLIPDSTQFQGILDAILGVPVEASATSVSDLLDAMNNGFGILGKRLPPDLISHRVGQWLPAGAQLLTDARLSSLQVPTLIVAGENDKFLPSKQEADRLTKLMPNSKKLLVKGSGHFVLDDRVNLTEAIIYSDFDPLKLRSGTKKYDPITDWRLPEEKELRATIDNQVQSLRDFTSPIFMSTDERGKRWMSLGKLPAKGSGPIVFVANHQIFGLDVGMIIAQLIEDRGILVRGLGHPVIFANATARPGEPDSPGIVDKPATGPTSSSMFSKFGAVKVTPRNYYRLLQTGQNVLLFPGGVREVFHGKNEAYKLFWPDTPDFVRTAARFNATIIPISAVGSADSVKILIDAPDIAKLPFGIGEKIVKQSENITSARFNQQNDEELFVPPFFVPNFPPARHYFVFGKPLTTSDIDHRDLGQCETFYKDVKLELERGFEDVLRSREKDPYKDNVKRLAYEKITGKIAPTFPLKEMNRKI